MVGVSLRTHPIHPTALTNAHDYIGLIRKNLRKHLFTSESVNMVTRHEVEGYDSFVQFMKDFNANGQKVIILFTGSDTQDGQSWCDYCVRAHPIIEEAISKYVDPNSHVIKVKVGDRPFWKDMNCPFRKDTNTRLMVLPTLLIWKTPQRLEGDQCGKMELLELLFTEDSY